MEPSELSGLREQIYERLHEASARLREAQSTIDERSAGGVSEDGVVSVQIDGRGFLKSATFDRSMTQRTSEELRESFLGALARARVELSGGSSGRSPDAILNDTRVQEAYLELLHRSRGETV